MAAGLLIISNYMPALDTNGDPVPGAKLNVYLNGTTTVTTTYSNVGLSTAHANPVVADSSGAFPLIYADSANSFSVAVTDADGAPLAAYDDIQVTTNAAVASAAYAAAAAISATASAASAVSSQTAATEAEQLLANLYAAAVTAGVLGGMAGNEIRGLTLSTAGSSTTVSIASGAAVNSTAVALMVDGAATKTTAAWALGAGGGLDIGTIANNTWYHWYKVRRPDTGVVETVFSLSAASPSTSRTGAAYTQFRRIGSTRTNGSGQWIAFVQDGDRFIWTAPTLDVNVSVPVSGLQQTNTLTVPTGVSVVAMITAQAHYTSGAPSVLYVYEKQLAATPALAVVVSSTGYASVPVQLATDTSAQIYAKLTYGGATDYSIETLGWMDRRGRG